MSAALRVLAVGGGAAGMMAALTAAERGARVTLLERNPKVWRKLYITGKGRCTVTNSCPAEEVLGNVPRNSRFLYSAMTRFPPSETMAFFEALGVPLKTERGNRVFPASDRAADIIDALYRRLCRMTVLEQGRAARLLTRDGTAVGVELEDGRSIAADRVIVATGGVSYPLTGSTGDGYVLARQAGHTVISPVPSLVPLEAAGDACPQMQGLALKNVSIQVRGKGKKPVYSGFGELLFTHFGLSGPLILSASAHMRDFDKQKYSVIIDLKPALDQAKLDARLLRDLEENANRDLQNVLEGLVPKAMAPVLCRAAEVDGRSKAHSVTREQRRRLLETLKGFRVEITGPRPVEEAIVTSGGVKVSEVDPSTMESRRMKGLYFAGEVLDVDAYTGGFNLQIAWATGRAAGWAAAESKSMPADGGHAGS